MAGRRRANTVQEFSSSSGHLIGSFRRFAAGGGYSLAPFIHSRIVRYSGESLDQRTPPPCEIVFAPATPSLSEVEVGFSRRRLFSGSARLMTFEAVSKVPLN